MDEATLDDSMNDAIKDILITPIEERSPEAQAEIYLYYVACSRAKYKLNNAKYLPKHNVKPANQYDLDPRFTPGKYSIDEEIEQLCKQFDDNGEVEI